jgi:3-oxoacyl-[acyl-carrier protein] reductase
MRELGGAHYTASKAGVLRLNWHMAGEYGGYGININEICPGLVGTQMVREQAGSEKHSYWINQIPLKRFADPKEEADLVLFLASDQASYITGATIDFNGGSLLL